MAEAFVKPESWGWDRPNPRKRVLDPSRPLYVYKAQQGGIYVGEAFVPRGHRLPAELAAELGGERVKLMYLVRELDHAPIEGLTPPDQLPDAAQPAPAPRKDQRTHRR
jgi:hypothetical protein